MANFKAFKKLLNKSGLNVSKKSKGNVGKLLDDVRTSNIDFTKAREAADVNRVKMSNPVSKNIDFKSQVDSVRPKIGLHNVGTSSRDFSGISERVRPQVTLHSTGNSSRDFSEVIDRVRPNGSKNTNNKRTNTKNKTAQKEKSRSTTSGMDRILNATSPDPDKFHTANEFAHARKLYKNKSGLEDIIKDKESISKMTKGSKDWKKMEKKYGIEDGEDLLKKINKEQDSYIKNTLKKEDAGFIDKAVYHHYPEKAAGIGVAATLMTTVFGANKGSQSNSQLYNPNGPGGQM